MDDLEKYTCLLGAEVHVVIDRPIGSRHPRLDFVYETHYGYVPETCAGDGSEIDAWVVGVDEPVASFTGRCVAVIARRDDAEHKLVVAPCPVGLDEIRARTGFVEQHYDTFVIADPGASARLASLVIFSGLPGVGKSTLARRLAGTLQAAWLRIDTIEQALRDLCDLDVEGEGYSLAYRVAADNLAAGVGVVADSCNPIVLTRQSWESIARNAGVPFFNVELICSDLDEHKARVESRPNEVPGLDLPDYSQVERREYDAWSSERIVIDTAGKSIDEAFAALLKALDLPYGANSAR